ncbi:YheC/YheD family protein [Paenibacillus thalictri]|uniref:YheC/YheD family protein n=1 Tax=Paenibacillus thalictri TaxID=2527873 RepID=A0A4Q9DPC8_9BACL|nr:YheC/YheD family protein [Paenibacillus thalictri]TBL75078.1 YheC/YheD family protein [Paenibacillus thalictri]
MSLTTCTVHVTQRPERAIYVTSELARALRLGKAKSVTLKLGIKHTNAQLKILKKDGKHAYFPSTLANAIKIPQNSSCMVMCNNGRDIQFGPLIGIMTGVTGSGTRPFGSRTELIRSYISAGTDRSFMFAFSPQSVNWSQETVVGYFLRKEGGWTRKTVPLPDVIYNRLPSRKAEKMASMDSFKQRFLRRGISLFNWSFFEKWDVYNLLEGTDAFKHVPESHINPTSSQIKDMLDKHKFIYLKPTGGSLGIGIYRVTYNAKRGYYARFRRSGKNVLLRFNKFEGLMNLLNRQKGRLNHYVAQQGIRLIEIDSCPIDFRFHLTKNINNQWVVAGIGAKKAGKGSVTTHVRTGGQLMTPEQVLKQIFGSRGDQVLDTAKETAIKLAESLEKKHRHMLGELGFDIGIDQNEKIWMFEANSKPGRSIFKHPALKGQGKATVNHIFEYCQYLSRFRPRREA